jgi:hypothetical protein
MKRRTLSLIFILSLLAPAAAVAGGSSNVTVVFDHPEKFTDIKDSYIGSESGRDAILTQIRQYVESQAKSYLREDQRLEVTFTNIDLAGDYEPWQGPRADSVRMIRDIYPPRIDLEFKLVGADGRVISEGKSKLCDLAFQSRVTFPSNDELRYEKALLKDWLSDKLGAVKSTNH